MTSVFSPNPLLRWNPFNRNVPPKEQPTFRSFLDEFFGVLELEPIGCANVGQDEQPPDQVQDAHGLVGVARCIEIVFPDPKTRPSVRTFRRWQAQGLIPYKKIGRPTFFDPDEVREAIDACFTIAARN